MLLVAHAAYATSVAQTGPRPDWLVRNLPAGDLKTSLESCLTDNFVQAPHDFSIGHRGACLQFPEHTAESYIAAIELGAGIVECDVAVTSDGELVCRHSQCDLHTTTNILTTDLASKCSTPFTPADSAAGTSATASCCTSDITLAEFKTLCGKMDASNSDATTAEEYVATSATAAFRTDLYSNDYDGPTCPTVVSHAESIAIINGAGRKFTPELKTFTQGDLTITYDEVRQKLVDEYKSAGISIYDVWLQSFNEPDVTYWIANEPLFGAQAVMLDGNYTYGGLAGAGQLGRLYAAGVRYVAPPVGQLIKANADGTGLLPSDYATNATAEGLKIITWTVERNYGCWPTTDAAYATPACSSFNELELIDALHNMGVVGVFSDWPAATTFYANCKIATRNYTGPGDFANLGPRPKFLVDKLDNATLQTKLQQCTEDDSFVPTTHDFSIGHRGACLQFPEHTAESYRAAIELGAGIVECDVAVTSDGELVCRHSQCDLHTTTNILTTDLASKCSTPFTPADSAAGTSATASCCTSDITLAEFKTLCGKMDASNSDATTAEEYVATSATAAFRTDLYSNDYDGSSTCPTVVSHAESIAIINGAGRKFTPELKTFTQGDLTISYDEVRQKLVDEYKAADVAPSRVWLQSFNEPDVLYWTMNEPAWGAQAVMLDGNYTYGGSSSHFNFYTSAGIHYVAPPVGQLIKASADGTSLLPSDYAVAATAAGLKMITWTVERNYGCWPSTDAAKATPACTSFNELELIDTLYSMGVVGVFSDWPAATTFYASCMDHIENKKTKVSTCGEAKAAFQGSACCNQDLSKSLV